MIPGEVIPAKGDIVLNGDRTGPSIAVANTGDRPVQVGSHYHFAEVNAALAFDRSTARGCQNLRRAKTESGASPRVQRVLQPCVGRRRFPRSSFLARLFHPSLLVQAHHQEP